MKRAQIVQIGAAQMRSAAPKRPVKLTEEERRLLLEELADIAAELDELKSRAAEVADRIRAQEVQRESRTA